MEMLFRIDTSLSPFHSHTQLSVFFPLSVLHTHTHTPLSLTVCPSVCLLSLTQTFRSFYFLFLSFSISHTHTQKKDSHTNISILGGNRLTGLNSIVSIVAAVRTRGEEAIWDTQVLIVTSPLPRLQATHSRHDWLITAQGSSVCANGFFNQCDFIRDDKTATVNATQIWFNCKWLTM